MPSHLDKARKELHSQRILLVREIGQLERQLKKIDRAIDSLAPFNNGNGPVTRSQPDSEERQRRNDVLVNFYHNQHNGQEFDLDYLMQQLEEPEELRRAYAYLLRQAPNHFTVLKPGLFKVVK